MIKATKNKNIITLVIVIALIVGAIYLFEQTKAGPSNDPLEQEVEVVTEVSNTGEVITKPATKNGFPLAPELTGLTGYINTEEGIQISDFEGKVVLIDFWTYTCINCIRTLPHIKAWHEKYADEGLVIIGVHTPEFEFEKEQANVIAAMQKHGLEYIVVQDNDFKTWRAYKNRYWPRKYLIDSEGYIRYDHIGEGAYDETERQIQKLLSEINDDVDKSLTKVEDETPRRRQTPELYAGNKFNLPRGQDLGNDGGLKPGTVTYTLPEAFRNDVIYLEGDWQSNEDDLLAKSDGEIVVNFISPGVNIVADSPEPSRMIIKSNNEYLPQTQAGKDVKFDGEISYVDIVGPQLYNIYDGRYERQVLILEVEEGFSFNAFTFG